MVVRDRKDGSAIVSIQKDHAELSSQFAAHWGNKYFTQLRPYESMVFATTYHDSGYREWEGAPPMNLEKGRPYPFDISPIKFSVRARIIPAGTSASEEACREAYHKASRLLLNFEITD